MLKNIAGRDTKVKLRLISGYSKITECMCTPIRDKYDDKTLEHTLFNSIFKIFKSLVF